MSRIVHYASWLAVILTVLATVWWTKVFFERPGGAIDGWGTLGFLLVGALPLGIGILVAGAIPSSILCFRGQERRDRISLVLAGTSLLVVLIEAMILLAMVRW